MFNVLEYNSINPQSSFVPTPVIDYDKPVVGMSRDGVINMLGPGTGYVYRPDMFTPIPESLEAVALLRSLGHRIVIITDQSGISKSLFKQYDVDSVHQYMLQLLGEAGCPSIDAIYYSTSNLKEDEYAKPNVGMFKRCEKEHPFIQFSKGWYVGDCIRDLKAADKIGAKPILVRTGKGAETEEELNKFANRELKKKTLIFDSLMDFVATLR